jgi:hypothetical protein
MSGCAAILAGAILFAARINPRNLLACYIESGGKCLHFDALFRCLLRGYMREAILTSLLTIPLIIAVILIFFRVVLPSNGKGRTPYALFGLIGIATGVLGMMTNNDFNMSDTAIILFASAALDLYCRPRLASPRMRMAPSALIVFSIIAFSASGLMWGALRFRAKAGPLFHGSLLQRSGLTRLEEPSLFRGMRTGPKFIRLLKETKEVLKVNGFLIERPVPTVMTDSPLRHASENPVVFFGPSESFAYAAYGLRPYPGLPLWWWDIYGQGGSRKTAARTEHFKTARFRLCVFPRNDCGLPPQLIQYLTEYYDVSDTDELRVYVLRAQHSAGAH